MKMKQKANFEGRAFGSLCINDSSLAKAQSTILIKFIYSEKATNFCETFTLLMTVTYLCNLWKLPKDNKFKFKFTLSEFYKIIFRWNFRIKGKYLKLWTVHRIWVKTCLFWCNAMTTFQELTFRISNYSQMDQYLIYECWEIKAKYFKGQF